MTAHGTGYANRSVGHYKIIGDHDETCLSRKDVGQSNRCNDLSCDVVVKLDVSFQWLVEEPVGGEDPRESEVETYFDAPDMVQPGVPVREATGLGGAPDLEAEVRRRVNTEINAQLRELQESILQEREIALRNTGVGVGDPLQSSTPAGQPGVNSRGDISVGSPQVFSPISRSGGNCLMGADKIPPAQNLFESQGQHQDSGSYMTG